MKQLTLCLYFIGIVLVWQSETIAVALATVKTGPSSYMWDHENARKIAETCRWLGAMFFAAGLIERLILTREQPVPPSDQDMTSSVADKTPL